MSRSRNLLQKYLTRPAARRARPALERLEDRATPAQLLVFGGDELAYNATFNEVNNLTVSLVNGRYRFSDPGNTITLGFGLAELGFTGNGTSTVTGGDDAQINEISVLLNDRNDTASFLGLDDPVTVNGEGGDDVLAADINGDCVMRGASGDDILTGGDGFDTLEGGGGDDSLYGGDRSDSLDGGTGNDTLKGGDALDTLDGGLDDDSLYGGDSNDTLIGGGGLDTLVGGGGLDTVAEDASAKTAAVTFTVTDTSLTSNVEGLGDDRLAQVERVSLIGGSASDTLNAAAFTGSCTLIGNRGNDTLTAGAGGTDRSTLDGGGGNDRLTGSGKLDSLIGGQGHDTLVGGLGDDTLTGGLGNDSLDGGGGDDLLQEAADTDVTLTPTALAGGALLGNDTLASIDRARLTGGDGNNLLNASAFALSVTLNGGGGNDTLRGGGGDDQLVGGSGDDSLVGNNGNDRLLDFGDAATMTGGAGNDTLNGGGGIMRVIESGNVNWVLSDAALVGNGSDTLFGIDEVSLTGGAGNNTFTVSGRTEGNDTLNGGGGTDRVVSSADLSYTLSNTRLDPSNAALFTLTGIEQAQLTGGAGDNTFLLDGFVGNTTLNGGTGTDSLVASYGSAVAGALFTMSITLFKRQQGSFHTNAALASIDQATVVGGSGTDAFVVTNWTLPAVLDGGAGGADRVEAANDVNMTLTNAALIRAGFAVIAFEARTVERAVLTGGAGNNLLDASAFTLGPVTLGGGSGNDTLRGGSGNDVLDGGAGTDELDGNAGADTLLNGETLFQD